MAKYQSKSNQPCLENRKLFGFDITCLIIDWVNIMTIFFTGLSNRASWMVFKFTRRFTSSYLSWERLYFQRSIIRVVQSWHIVLYYANVWVLYHKVIVHCVLVWQHLLCGCVRVCAGMYSLQVETSSTPFLIIALLHIFAVSFSLKLRFLRVMSTITKWCKIA